MKRSFVAVIFVLLAYVIAVTTFRMEWARSLDRRLSDDEQMSLGPRGWPPEWIGVALDAAFDHVHGRHPYPRGDIAELFDAIHAQGAAVILSDLLFNGKTDPAQDARLKTAIAQDHVVLPVALGERSVHLDAAQAAVVSSAESITLAGDPRALRMMWGAAPDEILPPEPEYAAVASGLGHISYFADEDSLARTREPVLPMSGGRGIPSLGLVAWMHHAGFGPDQVHWEPGRLRLPNGTFALDARGAMLVDPIRTDEPMPTVSALDVLDAFEQKKPLERLKDRIAIVYLDALGDDRLRTTQGDDVAGVLVIAADYRVLSRGHAPRAATRAESVGLLVGLLLLTLLASGPLSRAAPRWCFLAGAAGIVVYVGVVLVLGRTLGIWLPTLQPALFVAISSSLLSVRAGDVMHGALQTAEARADAKHAPTGRVALVFTDVQGSTDLWDRHPDAMRVGLAVHDAVLRGALERRHGYEVKTEGDAFMIAFPSALDAASWCIDVQLFLLEADWPAEILAELGEIHDPRNRLLWRGLRVRMGIHVGEPEARPDPKTGRMDYFGPVVNRAARVSAAAHGGQIVLSAAAKTALEPDLAELGPHRLRLIGQKRLKGLSEPELLIELLPWTLSERRFGEDVDRASDPGLPR